MPLQIYASTIHNQAQPGDPRNMIRRWILTGRILASSNSTRVSSPVAGYSTLNQNRCQGSKELSPSIFGISVSNDAFTPPWQSVGWRQGTSQYRMWNLVMAAVFFWGGELGGQQRKKSNIDSRRLHSKTAGTKNELNDTSKKSMGLFLGIDSVIMALETSSRMP